MFSKISVNGPKTHPIYKFLRSSLDGGILGSTIKWNFAKFLVDKEGRPVKRSSPRTKPLELEQYIVDLLDNKKIS